MEESPYHGATATAASRPSLGFPVGTALLLLVIFSLSGIFSCCYHWDKLRRRSYSLSAAADGAKSHQLDLKQKQSRSSLPVIMPGDNVPKFIALPCPCKPPRPVAEVVVHLQKAPPYPPRFAVPPFY